MYTGHNLLYAYKLTLSDIKDIFYVQDEIDCRYEIKEFLDILFSDKNIDSLEFLFLPCCYFNPKYVFLGFYIGQLDVQYRNKVNEYNSIEDYYNNYFKMLEDIKEDYSNSINKYEDDIHNLFVNFPKIKEFLKKDDIKFYTVPTDCESCT